MPNAIISCRLCAKRFDKGAPPDPTQDDSTFVCEPCAQEQGGYPQNGWINPLVLRLDLSIRPDVESAPATPATGWMSRFFGKK